MSNSNRVLPERIAEIRERESKATKGPWFRWKGHDEVFAGEPLEHTRGHLRGHDQRICEMDEDESRPRPNANFIAHARQDIPDLLEDRDALEARIEGLEFAAATTVHTTTIDVEADSIALTEARKTIEDMEVGVAQLKELNEGLVEQIRLMLLTDKSPVIQKLNDQLTKARKTIETLREDVRR